MAAAPAPPRTLPGRRLNLGRRAVNRFAAEAADEVPAGALVLDLGAGEGWYRHLFDGRRYRAVDLAVGDARWDFTGLDVLADLHLLPFATDSVDAVLTTQTLEHLIDPGAFLIEVGRVLRPGGRLYLTAPQSFREHQAPHDYWRFTRYSLRLLAERAGFTAIEVEPLGGYFAFMGDRLPAFHRYLFPKRWARGARILTAPFWLLTKPVCTWLAPWVCERLDPLDTKRTWTNGYGLRATAGEGPA